MTAPHRHLTTYLRLLSIFYVITTATAGMERHEDGPQEMNADNPNYVHKHTAVPSSSPSSVPTGEPSNGPTLTPFCEIDEFGNYGNDSSDAGMTPIVLTYAYEVETKIETLGMDVKDLIETALANELLAQLFEVCPSKDQTTTQRILQEETMKDLVGFSSSPEDRVDDAGCRQSPSENRRCTLIRGQFQLISQSTLINSTSILQEEAMATVQTIMERDDVLYVRPSITDIQYVDSLSLNAGNSQTHSSGKGGPTWVIAPALVAAFASAAIVIRRWRKNKGEDADSVMSEDVEEIIEI